MVRIAVFLGNNEHIFLLLFEIMTSQVCKPFGTLQCWRFSLNSTNSAAVFSYLFVLLARRSSHEPHIHDQGLLVPGLSENTNTAYWCVCQLLHFVRHLTIWVFFALRGKLGNWILPINSTTWLHNDIQLRHCVNQVMPSCWR